MGEDKANFDSILSGFTLSVLYAACSEFDADTLSNRQTKTNDTDKTVIETTNEREETASEEERAAVFSSLRNTELDRLSKAENKTRNEQKACNMHDQTNRGAIEEINTEKDKETASEEERAAFFRDVRGKELDRLSANKRAVKEMHTEKDKETASEEERAAFFKEFTCRSKELEVQTEPKIMKKESLHNQDETEALDTEETVSEEDRLAFF
ncbi:unnamed protein product [Mytilus coruscus]|uniref:Uncharacterized protein n=1 Tax=Mytilus coruscus TaxID=42192 RepID=A0A6J8CJL3_MYTCO|nr:unnamed protein product [Mytilus coruscus]